MAFKWQIHDLLRFILLVCPSCITKLPITYHCTIPKSLNTKQCSEAPSLVLILKKNAQTQGLSVCESSFADNSIHLERNDVMLDLPLW